MKGFCTESGIDIASTGIQVHGGMGYVEETGAAQTFRDARITSIYEGTTGIQSNDLIGRKVGRDRGAVLLAFLDEMQKSLDDLSPDSRRGGAGAWRRDRRGRRGCASRPRSLLAALATSPDRAMAVSVPFLKLCGFAIGGWLMARARGRRGKQTRRRRQRPRIPRGKLATAHFYADAGFAAGAHARVHRRPGQRGRRRNRRRV